MIKLRNAGRAALLSAVRWLCLALLYCGMFSGKVVANPLPPLQPAWEKLAANHFNHLGLDQGLPHIIATALAQDRQGFLWVGTQGGLARWDGYRFRHYQNDARQSNTLPDDLIQVLHLDAQGRLWLGTAGGGLARYQAEQDNFLSIASSNLASPSVYALVDDGANGLWVGSHGGLDHLDRHGKLLRRWVHGANSLPDNRVQALLRARDGTLWVGSGRGLLRMQGEQLIAQSILPSSRVQANAENQLDIRALWQAADGRIWLGTARHGAFIFDPVTGAVQDLSLLANTPLFAKALINSITAHANDEVWLGSFGQGIYAVNLQTMAIRQIERDASQALSLADNAIQAMFTDRSGLLWVASQRGLSRHDPHQSGIMNIIGNPGQPGKIGDTDVWSILPRKDGLIWLGLGNQGVDILHPQSGVIASLRPNPERPSSTLPATLVSSMIEHGSQTYIGSNRGLYRNQAGSNEVELLTLAPRKASSAIKTMQVADGFLWLGGNDGMWQVPFGAQGIATNAKATRAAFSDQLSDQRIVSFTIDQQKRLWIGTWNGLNLVDAVSGKVEKIMLDAKRSDGLAQSFISSLLCDRSGRLWVGTSGGGVHLWQGHNSQGQAVFRRFDSSNGMPNQIINQILQDKKGDIWVSTDGGLAKIVTLGENVFSVHALRRADGVQFPSYWSNSGAIAATGELLFGGSGGLTVLKPEQIQEWNYQPPLVITELRVDGKRQITSQYNHHNGVAQHHLQITAQANSFSVEFAALDFSAPEKNRYAYRLDGFDHEWLEAEASHRVASYTNLPPGEYRLRLRGSNRNGVWAANELVLPVTILPDWYETMWFRVFLVCLGAMVMLGFVHVRTNFLRQQKQVLAQEVTDRTAELRQQQQALLHANRELQHANQEMASSANTLRELGEIGREITANLELDAVFAALHLHVRRLLDAPTLSIYRADLEQGNLRYVFGREDEKVLPATSIAINNPNSNAARAARERREIILELEAGQLNPNPIPGTRNMLTLLFGPLIVDQRLLGVMSIQSDHARAYGERERMIFRTLCAYGAIALENGNAYHQLQEAQDKLVAQEKLAALGALVAGVAHELNTPLGNSLMMASVLQDNIDNLLSALHAGQLGIHTLDAQLQDAQEANLVLMRNLRNSAQLVNSFKQVAVDRTSAQRRVFDLRQTSLEVISTLSNQIKSQGHDIDIEIAADIMLDSYPGAYGQVLTNLISNALLHAFHGPGRMQLSAQRSGNEQVQIIFKDDGNGIAESDLKHIFDPFFTTKMGQGGKGLGLSVCFNLVTQLLGGQITVQSKAGQGTRFCLELPLVASL